MLPEQQPSQPQEQQPPAPAPQRSNRKWIVLAIAGCALIACAAVLVSGAAAAFFFRVLRSSTAQSTALVQQEPVIVQPSATPAATEVAPQQPPNSMGNPAAPVKVLEYADFQCPYCMRFSKETEPQIIEQYVKTGKVYFEYHSVGAFLGEESGAAAQAAYCAGDQGKFWEYHDTLFSHWTGENVGDFTKLNLQQYAAALGLDEASFNDCLSSGKYAALLEQDVKDARAAGISATPSFLVNGKLLE